MREANKFHFEIFSPSKSPEELSNEDIKNPKRWTHDELLELYLDQKNWKKTKNRRFLSKLLCRFTLDGNDYVLPVDSWRIRENLEQYITNYASKENIIPISKLQITTTARHSCSPDCTKQIVRNRRANFDRKLEDNHPLKIPELFQFQRDIVKLKLPDGTKGKEFKVLLL